MNVQSDGSYKASTVSGSTAEGKFYLKDGKLLYRSSRTTGTARLSEEGGKTTLTVTPEDTERMFSLHGARSLLVAKFIPGFSTIAPPLAGIVRMPPHEFVLFSGLGGLLWAGAFVVVGWLFAYQLEVAAEYAVHFGSWTLVLLAAAIGGYVTWKFIARERFLRKIRIARITPEELKIMLDGGEDMLVVDVRDRIDFEAEPSIIPGALHLTVEELDARHHEIPREREIVLYCS